MSHYHHHHHQRLANLPPHIALDQQQQQELALTPGLRNTAGTNYRPYSAGAGQLRYPGDADRYQSRPPTVYSLPWSFHPQYGEPQQQQQHPGLLPVSLPAHQNLPRHPAFRQQSGPPGPPGPSGPLGSSGLSKHLYTMPSPGVDVGNGRTGAGTLNSQSGQANSVSPDPENVKDHCDSIIQHPLFPLLRLLLEKLEEATVTAVTPSPEEINTEMENLVRLIQQSSASVGTGRSDVDDLMLQAVTVLRLHLFELEKVNELCRDFCDRYTACLRKNLHTDQILRSDGFEMEEPLNDQGGRGDLRGVGDQGGRGSRSRSDSALSLPLSMSLPYEMSSVQGPLPHSLHTGMMPGSSLPQHREEELGMKRDVVSPDSNGASLYDEGEKYDDDEDTSSGVPGGKMNRRGILPKDAINVMKSWLFQHIMHPYPTEDEKRLLAGQTRLSLLQVNNWFINARRRILQPMLDSAHPGGHRPKKGMQSRPVDPFWTAAPSATPSATPSDSGTTVSRRKDDRSEVDGSDAVGGDSDSEGSRHEVNGKSSSRRASAPE